MHQIVGPRGSRRLQIPALAAALLLPLAGCVERLLQIRTDPPGAEVFLNGVRAGTTPVDLPFDFYGSFDVTVRAQGRPSVHRIESVPPPWYELPPIDFFSENLVPWTIRDHREIRIVLEPAAEDGDRGREEALERSRKLQEALDAGAREGAAASQEASR